MKRLIAILTITTMLLCTACGSSGTGTGDNSVSSTAENSTVSQAENNDSSEGDKSSAADKESEPEDEGHYFDWRGINYFVPPYFEDTYRNGKSIWSKKLDSGSKEYLSQIMDISYGLHNGIDTYNLEDVPEILRESVISDIDEFYPLDPSSELTVETNDEKEVLGVKFIRHTGVVNVKLYGEPAGELYYTAYYGLLDMSEYDKVPMCWITFTDDESSKDELESTADLFAEKIEWVEE